MKFRKIIALLALLAWSSVANATFHLWSISEVYSNADGSVQFVELFTNAGGQQFVDAERITANSDGNVVTFTFSGNTPSGTAGRRLLIASPGFAGEEGAVAPDYTLPLSFFDPDANSIIITFIGASQISFSSSDLPTDGVLSLNKDLSTGTNSPTNFAGQTGQLTGQGPIMFTIGGNVAGLAGSGLVLQNNGGDNRAIGGNGEFTFATSLLDGEDYEVSIFSQPSSLSQTCSISNGSGTLAGADVTNVAVSCVTDTFTVGGDVSGLSGSGLVLQNNGGDNLAVSDNGNFTFATPLSDGSTYAVTVFTQPTGPNQTCSVSSGSGILAGSNITNVAVNCVTNTTSFTINPGLNGSWANFDTLGQGFFIDVFPDIPLIFFAWFTWEVEQQAPAQNKSPLQQLANSGSKLLAVVGDENHRWLTAQGPFEGNTAILDVTLTTGGLFDDPQEVTNSEMGTQGTMTLTFTDCKTGTVDYNFTAIGLSGSVPIRRLAEDNVELCETMDGIDDPQ